MDHESIEELLAGYVLRSLSGPDAREADRLLSEHVPTCPMCRDALGGFQEVAGDLALEPAPVDPPDVLLPRLHRELGPPARRRAPVRFVAAAASVVALVGMTGFAVTQGVRANHAQARDALVQGAIDAARTPGAKLVPVGPMTGIHRPGVREFYVYGKGVPDPAPGMVYRLWLQSGSTSRWVADFVPDDGVVIFAVEFDPSQFDRILVTEEPAGSTPTRPGAVHWESPA